MDRIELLESVLCGIAFDMSRGGAVQVVDGNDFDGFVSLRMDKTIAEHMHMQNVLYHVANFNSEIADGIDKTMERLRKSRPVANE